MARQPRLAVHSHIAPMAQKLTHIFLSGYTQRPLPTVQAILAPNSCQPGVVPVGILGSRLAHYLWLRLTAWSIDAIMKPMEARVLKPDTLAPWAEIVPGVG